MRCLPLILITTSLASAQTKATWNELPAYSLSNGLMDVTVLSTGGTIASAILAGDAEKLNPLWDPVRSGASGVGHFLCVDGFGGTSKEEQSAGLPNHGEARRQEWKTKSTRSENGRTLLTLETELPLVQERVTRTFELREGENILYVRTQLQSLVAFDRPVVWAEHATIGSPFLEAGQTVVDAPAMKGQTRPYTDRQQRRLASEKDFDWPMAPLAVGGTIDLRSAPVKLGSGDHTTQLMDPARKYAYATALHPTRRLIVGWIWKTADFPWLQNWESYPATGKLARGLEFSTQPYDIPRRQAVDMRQMFGAPTYGWLPAKSTLEKNFIFFYTRAPEGMTKVTDIRVGNGEILIEDGSGHRITLRATGPL